MKFLIYHWIEIGSRVYAFFSITQPASCDRFVAMKFKSNMNHEDTNVVSLMKDIKLKLAALL